MLISSLGIVTNSYNNLIKSTWSSLLNFLPYNRMYLQTKRKMSQQYFKTFPFYPGAKDHFTAGQRVLKRTLAFQNFQFISLQPHALARTLHSPNIGHKVIKNTGFISSCMIKKKLWKPEVLTRKKRCTRNQINLSALLYVTKNQIFGWLPFLPIATSSSSTQNAV